ncbi:glycosyltransferase [Olivibacter sitiensis]|uniref:glycosyltransferase n=1 Tax=Olivibacter sitiensis TaxID=376470 RepID=UPI0004885635|nr:glycosyltransferase [Olivibacter sitiensis]
MQNLAPIALFIYNRPEHTRRTLQYLRKNTLSGDSRLYIFSDAAKTSGDEQKVQETRNEVRHIEGFRSVKLITRDTHMGLANSIIDGISGLVNEYGKIIVLEDDLLTSPYTLQYFNEALERYIQEERVMQIAAYNFPLTQTDKLPESFFMRSTNSWGWATWKRAWDKFNPDIESLYQKFNKEKKARFTFNGSMNYWKQLMDFKKGKNDSWAIRWHASVFLNDGLVLYPRESLIENIGHDGSGVHSIIEDTYRVSMANKPIISFPNVIEECPEAVEATKHFYKHRKGSWIKRGKKFLTNQWKRITK